MAKIALVANSNPLHANKTNEIDTLKLYLESMDHEVILSPFIFSNRPIAAWTGKDKGDTMNGFFTDPSIDYICDVSGGDLANDVLPYLYYEIIANSKAQFVGYSDLTTVINAIYSLTGKSSILYQIRNLEKIDANSLFDFSYDFIHGDKLEGLVLGGNIRCLLKLAGTKYFPELEDRVLVLESFSGTLPRIKTYFNQLEQMGIFKKISGLLLGTFTELETRGETEQLIAMAREFVTDRPVVITKDIGHGEESKAIEIGGEIVINK